MRKIQDFMKNRCGIDELNLFCLSLGLVFYFLYIFFPEEKKIFACLGCLIFVVLSVCRMFSENLEWRKKENQVFVKVCSFFIPERKETKEEREARKKEKLDKKKRRNEELRQKTTNKVEERKEETKKEKKESKKEEDISEDKRENSVEKKKEEILRQLEEKREREQREKEEKRRKEEEKRAAEALAREQKKREQRKREQKFDPNYVYFNCPYCNQAIRIPKRQGKVKITCPTCKNKFIKET